MPAEQLGHEGGVAVVAGVHQRRPARVVTMVQGQGGVLVSQAWIYLPIEYAKASHLFAHLEDEVRVPDAGGGVEVECGHEVGVPRPRTRPEGEADTQELLLTQTVVLDRGAQVSSNEILVPEHILL